MPHVSALLRSLIICLVGIEYLHSTTPELPPDYQEEAVTIPMETVTLPGATPPDYEQAAATPPDYEQPAQSLPPPALTASEDTQETSSLSLCECVSQELAETDAQVVFLSSDMREPLIARV